VSTGQPDTPTQQPQPVPIQAQAAEILTTLMANARHQQQTVTGQAWTFFGLSAGQIVIVILGVGMWIKPLIEEAIHEARLVMKTYNETQPVLVQTLKELKAANDLTNQRLERLDRPQAWPLPQHNAGMFTPNEPKEAP
jgi:hypothetical protein